MKTPDEIKKALELCVTYGDYGILDCVNCAYKSADDEGAGCIDELLKDALAYIQQLEAAQPEWVSVKERLPDEYRNVLTYSTFSGRGFLNIEYQFRGQWWERMNPLVNCPTHWSPLPEPPLAK